MKIAIITCYKYPDYIRAHVLRQVLSTLPDTEVIVIKNKSTGIMRYPQVIGQIIKTRLTKQPDVYILTFRWDLLPIVRLLSLGKTFVLDELVNGIEYFNIEHKKFKGPLAAIWKFTYPIMARSAKYILADTEAHADVSSALSKIDRRKYVVVPVGTDEKEFPYQPMQPAAPGQPFKVFFYGYMLPLHGPKLVFEAAEILKDNPNIEFLVAGRIDQYIDDLKASQGRGARITYRNWVPFNELSELVAGADVNIAGPFGNTFQGKNIINGKTYQFLASGRVALVGESKATEGFINRSNCLIVPQGDANAIAREILWAYDNRDKLPMVGAAGRELYDAKFSNARMARTLRELFARL